MQRNALWFVALAAIVWGLATAAPPPVERNRVQGPVFLTGMEDTPFDGMEFPARPAPAHLDDPICPIYAMGTTWYDNQHNGTAGKQLAVDRDGFVHQVWTRGANSGSSIRHVFYNIWSPFDSTFLLPNPENPIGTQIDASPRAGFVTVDVNDQGFAFPAFHEGSSDNFHGVVAIDFLAGLGAFVSSQACTRLSNVQAIWPTISLDINGNIHVGLTESGGASAEYYARATPWISEGVGDSIQWTECLDWPSATFITIDVAASPVSEKIAVAWLTDPVGEHIGTDVWVRTSPDGGLTWDEPRNITNFHVVDTMCVLNGGNPDSCNGDTMRPWIDLSVLIEHNDVAHIAFSASGFYWWNSADSTQLENHGYVFSSLWHWDELHNEYNFIHEAWYGHSTVALGMNNLMVHRPNLAVDTVTGYLYCSFHKFDSVQVSAAGFPQGDAYITVSTDGGRRWAVATNVSNTDGGVSTPAGECMSERDITLAKYVTGGAIHMQYMLDLDAGSSIRTDGPEGVPTLNNIYYVPIPVELIPTSPLEPEKPLRADSTGFPPLATDDWSRPLPASFALYQNYPNPFNATTNIQFDLAAETIVSLRVFDVLGREAATVLSGQWLSAGAHVFSFDASSLPSGLYFYRLETDRTSATRKMVLMR